MSPSGPEPPPREQEHGEHHEHGANYAAAGDGRHLRGREPGLARTVGGDARPGGGGLAPKRHADYWVLAAKAAIEHAADCAYIVPFRYGCTDNAECRVTHPYAAGSRLPSSEGDGPDV